MSIEKVSNTLRLNNINNKKLTGDGLGQVKWCKINKGLHREMQSVNCEERNGRDVDTLVTSVMTSEAGRQTFPAVGHVCLFYLTQSKEYRSSPLRMIEEIISTRCYRQEQSTNILGDP